MLGLGLSMDAVAVSMTNGMTIKSIRIKEIFADAVAFGVFQGLMPVIGYFAGAAFAEQMAKISHWIALALLGFLGAKMLWDSFRKEEAEECGGCRLTWRVLFAQAVATSIDALAVGVSFAALQVNIWSSAAIIAVITFVCSLIAVLIGKKCGDLFRKKAGIFGGCILILIGIKIFMDGMFG